MKDYFSDILPTLISNPKIAATVAGSTTITSTFDLIQGGISIFAIGTGAILSITLIIIHWKRWFQEQKDSKIRLQIDVERSSEELKHFELENKKLQLEVIELKIKQNQKK